MTVSLAEYTDAALWHAWFLKSFGEPKAIADQLQHIALFGREESPDWATPWSAEIQRRLAISTPFSFQPWSGCDHTISAVTASQAAFYLMGLLHREVFADSALPDWNQAIEELTQQNRDYIAANLPKLQERVSSLFNCLNPSEWLRLAETVDVERLALSADDDETAYVPAATLRKEKLDRFPRAEQLTRFLEALNRDREVIRTRKPSKNRLLIHAGDWHHHFARQTDPLDLPAAVVDEIAKVEAQTQKERAQKTKR